MDSQQAARLAAHLSLACLDLTSLNDGDTEADVIKLCARAHGAHGTTAAVCVWPRFAALARREMPAGIAVAAVANFPDGSADIARAVRDTREIVEAGAQEVDVVLPFAALMQGDERTVAELLAAVRKACDGLALKVILETGVLVDDALITRASRLSLDAGADFLKTSTGKTPVSATREAAVLMLNAIAADPRHASVGFKASGGIRTVADATAYFGLVEQILGASALSPKRFRIGASSLLNDIEAVLGGQSAPPLAAPGTY
ncbi:MAG: deoxyribose-phosphate aldolase [Burkholderiales bacterium]